MTPIGAEPLLTVALGDRGAIVLPLQTLVGHLKAGEWIDDSLDRFTSVTREQVIAFVEKAKARVIEGAS